MEVRPKVCTVRAFSMYFQEDGSAFSDEEMLEFLRNLMIAGRDTTAVTLTWCAS